MGKESSPRPCESPVHTDNCCGRGTTKDHFTPKSIAKKLGWSKAQVEDPMNIQWLSPQCHTEKDRTTPRRLQEVMYQQAGGTLELGDHLTKDLTPERMNRKQRRALRETSEPVVIFGGDD